MNQRPYSLNQFTKQSIDIKCLTQLSVGLVIALFQYALPAYAGQLTASDINRNDAVFAVWFKWRLTTILCNAADVF